MEQILEVLAQLLAYLQGKKTTIVAILGAINTYALATGMIDEQLGSLLATLILIIGGGANYATTKLGSRMVKYM